MMASIGDVRRSLFLDLDDLWNGVVRDATARLEVNGEVNEAEVLKELATYLKNKARSANRLTLHPDSSARM